MPWYEPIPRSLNHRFQSSTTGANADHKDHEEEQEWFDEERDPRIGCLDCKNEFSDDSARAGEYLMEEEEEFNVLNYLNQHWDYGVDGRRAATVTRNDSESNENPFDCHPLNFDGLQHRVERQLANIFPGEDFPLLSSLTSKNQGQFSWNSRLLQPHVNSDKFLRSTTLTGDNDSKNLASPPRSGGDAIVSKTAQFFYPRPVTALQPYKVFFSPMRYATVDNHRDHKRCNADESKSRNDVKLATHLRGCEYLSQNKSQHLSHNNHAGGHTSHNRFHQQQFFHAKKTPCNGHEGMFEVPNEPENQNHSGYQSKEDANNDNKNHDRNDDDTASRHRPRKLFDFHNSPLPKRSPRKLKPVQTKLKIDPKTGKLSSSPVINLERVLATTNTKNKTWDDYGGIVAVRKSVDSKSKMDGGKETREIERKNSKKKKKDEGKKTKKPKRGASADIDVLLDDIDPRQNRSTNPSLYTDSELLGNVLTTSVTDNTDTKKREELKKSLSGTTHAAKRKKKSQNQDHFHQQGFSELNIQLDRLANVNDVVDDCTMPQLTEADFEGIEEMGLQNAGSCAEGLNRFIRHVMDQAHVSWTMLFLDPYTGNYDFGITHGANSKSHKKRQLTSNHRGYECTTPLLPSTKKYCTEKGPKCTAWNCTCDSQIRSFRGRAMLIGALFVFRDRADSTFRDNDRQDENHSSEQTFCYLLPLGPTGCTSEAIGFSRMATWCSLPFNCDVSLVDRWNALKYLLCSTGATKFVTYHAQVQLLPFYYHLMHDESDFASDRSNQNQFRKDSFFSSTVIHSEPILSSIWDLKIVSWMLRADTTDAELEFEAFREGFSHLVPRDEMFQENRNAPLLSQGLMVAKNDLEFLYRVYPVINQQLIDKQLLSALECIESPVQSILCAMECRGVSCFPHRLQNMEKKLHTRVLQLESKCRSIVDDPEFLLSSPQQVSHYIFDVLKLEVPHGLVAKTKAGSSHRSTSEEALKAIKSESINRTGSSPEIIDLLLEFRAVNKLLTTYIRGLPKFCRRDRIEGASKKLPARIFPQWMQTVARTGRLSCRKPNLQQIPNVGMLGMHPREAFVPSAKINGNELALFACDYSQKEVRILAHMSRDEGLLSLFQKDEVDIYKQMSSLIRNKPVEEVTADERSIFKQVTLAILYGMSANQVGKKLSISKTMAEQIMNDFFLRFRGVKEWIDKTKDFARRNHFVLTISGRRRYLDGINSNDNSIRSQAERQAINTVIQGSSADVMKIAMINMTKNLMEWKDSETTIRPRILLQIHDELLLELMLNTKDIKRLQSITLKSCCDDCQSYFGLKVPLLVKCSCGLSWGKMKEI